jgi:hypothetical protein
MSSFDRRLIVLAWLFGVATGVSIAQLLILIRIATLLP